MSPPLFHKNTTLPGGTGCPNGGGPPIPGAQPLNKAAVPIVMSRYENNKNLVSQLAIQKANTEMVFNEVKLPSHCLLHRLQNEKIVCKLWKQCVCLML